MNPMLWPFPVSTGVGDGLSFPHRRAKQFSNYHSIGKHSTMLFKKFLCTLIVIDNKKNEI